MKNKKKNKAQRQAGRRLCNNIKNGHPGCGFIYQKKETPIYASNMRVYISNASGQFTMDQHIDTTKLEELKEELSKKPSSLASSARVEVKPAQVASSIPSKERPLWWLVVGSILGCGRLLGVFLASRKKSA